MSADLASVRLDDIIAARERIGEALLVTPLFRAGDLGEELGQSLWLKAELLQRTGSFKPRGALNWVRTASKAELAPGLVTVSAGNHARALAWAAREVGADVTVVMPADASRLKTRATRDLGARVILHGKINEAIAEMERLRDEEGLTMVHPFDDPRVIAGQGTVGLEITEQLPDVDVVVCPIGGGGLISGLAVAMKAKNPAVKIYGVEAAGAPTLRTAWDHGQPTRLEEVVTRAPALGASLAGKHTFAISRQVVDDIIVVPEDEVVEGFRRVLQTGRLQAEPGGAIAIAALQHGHIPVADGAKVVAVVTGGNVDPELIRSLI